MAVPDSSPDAVGPTDPVPEEVEVRVVEAAPDPDGVPDTVAGAEGVPKDEAVENWV